MLKSIKHVLGIFWDAFRQVLSDPLKYAADAAYWMLSLGAALWLILFTANFVLRILGF